MNEVIRVISQVKEILKGEHAVCLYQVIRVLADPETPIDDKRRIQGYVEAFEARRRERELKETFRKELKAKLKVVK
jgi:hypothetical protein